MDSAGSIALAVVAVLLVVYIAWRLLLFGKREGFASERARAVHGQALKAFQENGGDVRYSDYQKAVPSADPVQYSDVRQLFLAGRLTPAAVQKVL